MKKTTVDVRITRKNNLKWLVLICSKCFILIASRGKFTLKNQHNARLGVLAIRKLTLFLA